jgi:hypothetical protein
MSFIKPQMPMYWRSSFNLKSNSFTNKDCQGMCQHKYKDPNRSDLVDVHSPAPCVVVIWSGLAGVWMRKGRTGDVCSGGKLWNITHLQIVLSLQKKKKGGRQQPWIKLVVMSSFALRFTKT